MTTNSTHFLLIASINEGVSAKAFGFRSAILKTRSGGRQAAGGSFYFGLASNPVEKYGIYPICYGDYEEMVIKGLQSSP